MTSVQAGDAIGGSADSLAQRRRNSSDVTDQQPQRFGEMGLERRSAPVKSVLDQASGGSHLRLSRDSSDHLNRMSQYAKLRRESTNSSTTNQTKTFIEERYILLVRVVVTIAFADDKISVLFKDDGHRFLGHKPANYNSLPACDIPSKYTLKLANKQKYLITITVYEDTVISDRQATLAIPGQVTQDDQIQLTSLSSNVPKVTKYSGIFQCIQQPSKAGQRSILHLDFNLEAIGPISIPIHCKIYPNRSKSEQSGITLGRIDSVVSRDELGQDFKIQVQKFL